MCALRVERCPTSLCAQKGDVSCDNWKGISLDVMGKLFARTLSDRLQLVVEADSQRRFRDCVNMIFCLRQLVHVVTLWCASQKYGVPDVIYMIQLLWSLHDGVYICYSESRGWDVEAILSLMVCIKSLLLLLHCLSCTLG